MVSFFKNKLTTKAAIFFRQHKPAENGLNALPPELKMEILDLLDYESLQAMACVSQDWKRKVHLVELYHSKEYYIMSGHCDAGMIRSKTINIHTGNSGTGPVFVPFPRINLDCYRFTNPSPKEFLEALTQESSQLFQLYREKPAARIREDREFPIFKVKLKKDVHTRSDKEKNFCSLNDIQQIISGEFTWHPEKRFGLFAVKPRHIERNFKNQFAPEIEKLRLKGNGR